MTLHRPRLSWRRSLKLQLLVLVLLFLGGLSAVLFQQVSADVWGGQGPYTGYFSNIVTGDPYCNQFPGQCSGGDVNDVLPPITCNGDTEALPGAAGCIDNVHNLITLLRGANSAGSASRKHASSAFIYWTLLGKQRAFANANGGRDPTGYNIPGVPSNGWTALELLLNAELADGQITINWHEWSTEFPRTYSMFDPGSNQADVAYDKGDGSQTGFSIVIRNKAGKRLYTLFRACANPGGTLLGLPALDNWGLTGKSTVVATAQAGDTVTFKHTVTNNGGITADFSYKIQKKNPTLPGWTDVWGYTATSLGAGRTTNPAYTHNETIPNSATPGQLFCERIDYTNANGPATAANQSPQACVKVVAPLALSCGNANTAPPTIQPGDSFTTDVHVRYGGGPVPTYTAMKLDIPAIGYTGTVPKGPGIKNTGSDLGASFGPIATPPAAPNNYPMTWQLLNGGVVVWSCPGWVSTLALPYFNVFGGDISSGGDFSDNGSSCANPPGDGTISSWYNNKTATAGANALFSAIALGQITGFGSAQDRPGPSNNAPPLGLTFANKGTDVPTDSETFTPEMGGFYAGDPNSPTSNGGVSCLYTPEVPSGTPGPSPAPAILDVSTLGSQAYNYNGDMRLDGGAGIAPGKNVSVFVNGNVYIGSNIFYTNPNAAGNWSVNAAGTSNVPSFTLKVTGGNIYIDHTVSQLDGIYVAEAGGGTGGTIYTCGTALYAPDTAASLVGCNKQLTVNGGFVADQVNLMRTFGTLKDAQAGEFPGNPTRPCGNGPPASVCGAEVFNLSPELYLSNPAVLQPSGAAPTYDSITNLPPVL